MIPWSKACQFPLSTWWFIGTLGQDDLGIEDDIGKPYWFKPNSFISYWIKIHTFKSSWFKTNSFKSFRFKTNSFKSSWLNDLNRILNRKSDIYAHFRKKWLNFGIKLWRISYRQQLRFGYAKKAYWVTFQNIPSEVS